ncbi:MAG: hypothetical protein JHD04_00905 [Nocardioides sp.]|nr:hypothetical protein [Nocardioides sp.]
MPDDRRRRADPRALLLDADDRPTPVYRRYLELQREYDAAVRRRDEARDRAHLRPALLQAWPQDSRAYTEAVDAALVRWRALGHKAEVEAALDQLADPPTTTDPPTGGPHHA